MRVNRNELSGLKVDSIHLSISEWLKTVFMLSVSTALIDTAGRYAVSARLDQRRAGVGHPPRWAINLQSRTNMVRAALYGN